MSLNKQYNDKDSENVGIYRITRLPLDKMSVSLRQNILSNSFQYLWNGWLLNPTATSDELSESIKIVHIINFVSEWYSANYISELLSFQEKFAFQDFHRRDRNSCEVLPNITIPYSAYIKQFTWKREIRNPTLIAFPHISLSSKAHFRPLTFNRCMRSKTIFCQFMHYLSFPKLIHFTHHVSNMNLSTFWRKNLRWQI